MRLDFHIQAQISDFVIIERARVAGLQKDLFWARSFCFWGSIQYPNFRPTEQNSSKGGIQNVSKDGCVLA
jgi:hypothetical protein